MDVIYQYERGRADQRGSGSGRCTVRGVRKVSCPSVLLASQILNLDLRRQNALHSPKAAGRVRPGRPGKRREEKGKEGGGEASWKQDHALDGADPPGTRPHPKCDFCQASQLGR